MAEPGTHPCFECNFLNILTAPVCGHCGADLLGAPIRRDLKTEADLWAVALWFRILAVSSLMPAMVSLIADLTNVDVLGDLPVLFRGKDFRSVSAGIALYATGHFLCSSANAARIIGGLFAALFAFASGLGLSILIFGGPTQDTKLLVSLPAVTLFFCYSFKVACLLFGADAKATCSPMYRPLIIPNRERPLGYFENWYFWMPPVILLLFIPVLLIRSPVIH